MLSIRFNMISKMHSVFLSSLLAILFLFTGCDEEKIRFTEPQPAGVEPEKTIQKPLAGDYFSNQDSTNLHITSDKIWLSNEGNTRLEGHISEDVEGNVKLGSDSGIHLGVKIKSKKRPGKEDSVSLEASYEETLVDLTKGDEIRFFKGYYFLNQPVREGKGYLVRILRPTSEGLLLCRIESDSVLQLLSKEEFVKKEKKEEDQEDSWTLEPTRKELKKLIDLGLFSRIVLYKRKEGSD